MKSQRSTDKLASIIEACVDDLLNASDKEIDSLYAEQYPSNDITNTKLLAQKAILLQRKFKFQTIRSTLDQSTIEKISHTVRNFSKERIDSILSTFLDQSPDRSLGLAFRNESVQSDEDRATLLVDLALKGFVNLDTEIN